MLKKTSHRKKLILFIFILIFISIFFSAYVILNNYKRINSLYRLNRDIILSSLISNLLHSLQKERGLSTGYLLNRNRDFKERLLSQRVKSDNRIKALHSFIHKADDIRFASIAKRFHKKVKKLKSVRHNIDIGYFSYTNVMDYYSDLNAILFKILINVIKQSYIPSITQNLMGYVNFLYQKENIGKERALGIAILSKKNYILDAVIEFNSLIAMQKNYESMFLEFSSKDIVEYYKKKIKLEPFKEVEIMEQWVKNQDYLTKDISSFIWYKSITRKLNILGYVSKYIQQKIKSDIQKEMNKTRDFFILNVILLFTSLFIFIYMLVELIKLINNEQKLRVVMEKYVIHSITDTKGIIKDVSEAFCNISGYSKKELIGKPHNIVRHPDMKKETFKDLWSSLKSGKSWQGKIKNLRKDGSYYWVYSHMEPLYDKSGKIDSYISIRVDVTEQEKLLQKVKEEEEKLKIQEKMMQQQHRLAQMGEMIAMIAHQWRQPLSAISAAAGVLEMKSKLNKLDKDTALQMAQKIREFSNHLSSTIDDFRNFFKSNKKKERSDFLKIVNDVRKIIQPSIESNHIELNIIKKEVEEFESYENELKQVILNLVKNAEDALLEKEVKDPVIDIIIDKKSIAVMDNAGGIPEDIVDKIFDPYFSTKKKKDGTGLGLYMSKIIVEEHCGGKLTVSNSKKGAVFLIVL